MNNDVRPKKYLGQHFLTDRNIAEKIVSSMSFQGYSAVLEVGAGKGILTEILVKKENIKLKSVDIDSESVKWLINQGYASDMILEADFLKLTPESVFAEPFAVIGNFPYNISSQIMFRILEFRDRIPEMTGMFQKEVAVRIASNPGSKSYGILSVLVGSYYKVSLLFSVPPDVFYPPPKVMSAVIRIQRLPIDNDPVAGYSFLAAVVKAAFGQRRKMLRNSLSSFGITNKPEAAKWLTKRPEQLGVDEFQRLAAILKNP